LTGPLSGLRVVDCSTGTAGPRATGMLADYGAEVIWVEPPGGDRFRADLAIPYAVFNRGKRDVVLDLKDDRDRERMFRLLGTADVFFESWRPGVAGRLGLGWDTVHQRFPGLVYTSITGFGADGPHRDLPGYESLVHAVAGSTGEQAGHREPPIYQALPFASIGAAMLGLIGTLAALYRRGEDGHGRHVETSLLDGALSFLGMLWGDSDDESLTPPVRPGSIRLVSRTYRCADNEYLGVHTGAVGAFGRLIRVLGLQDRIPATEDGTDMRIPLTPEQSAIVLDEIPEIFARESRAAWLDKLLKADICAVPALRPGEVFDEPQPRHNGMALEVEDPVLGRIQQVAPPVKIPQSPPSVRGAACTVGQHTAEVFAELDAGTRPELPVPAGPPADGRPLLDGLRVLDIGAYYAGPYSSRLLADLGADVIKLETTLGDQLRGIPRPFRSAQAGKRGIALNLKDPALAPALDGLLSWADAITHNMRPGAAERLGFGYEELHARFPRLIYCHTRGFEDGPRSLQPGTDQTANALAGTEYEDGACGRGGAPFWSRVNTGDTGNGYLWAIAVIQALYHRERTGQGQLVGTSIINACLLNTSFAYSMADGSAVPRPRIDQHQRGLSALHGLYRLADDWLCIAILSEDAWPDLCAVLESPQLRDDPRFATAEARASHDAELRAALEPLFARRSGGELVPALEKSYLPCELSSATFPVELFDDPLIAQRGWIATAEVADVGRLEEPARLVEFSANVPPGVSPPCLAGQHTREILAELGFGDAAIAKLIEADAVVAAG
jgi:crotonobetainyl-CoA:carnitine CoA-transferase CaiB-like acyl-CoA transferase